MRILRADATECFRGSADAPLQVVRVDVEGRGAGTLEIAGGSVRTPSPTPVTVDGVDTFEVDVEVSGGLPGHLVDTEVVLTDDQGEQRRPLALRVAEPGWRMFMVSHFHYDPVWWNTQAFYTETWEKLPREERPWEGRKQQPAFTLIDAHLDVARRDPDYRFVLAELDYLKPYWDTFPWRRDELRQLIADGRLELMGGTYNEPNTNLTSAESTARNAVYGVSYQRDVLGGDPATAWQLDAFGHDPQFPGMMADAGLSSSSWARGPFQQWGPSRSPGGNASMQFPSEFDWIAPSGRSLFTSYMPNHYSAGWELDSATDLEEALEQAYELFLQLRSVAATPNVLLPVGSDYTPPNRWMTRIARSWNDRYLWPRFEVALPRDFFAAVRASLADGPGPSPQTRDMNPIYSGKDVSYIDTKQAQRVGENTLLAAERFGTFASLLGARYPTEAIDKAWRQLLFGAHHDGITGTESDQVYLDLLGGWRDTYELASEALDGALDHLGGRIERLPGDAGATLTVFNALSWDRTDLARVRIEPDDPSPALLLYDDQGHAVDFVIEDEERDRDGHLRGVTLLFIARDVPSVGYRSYRVAPAETWPDGARWTPFDGTSIANEVYALAVDPERGGAITTLTDRRDGTPCLQADGLANEILAYTEYPTHPEHGEGPWHLLPTGEVEASSDTRAQVHGERSAIGERLLVRAEVAGCAVTQQIALYDGFTRVVCTTDLDGFSGQDTLFRARFAAEVPGGLPISEVGNAVVGRGAGFPNVDVAQAPYTLDSAAYDWFGVGTTARVDLSSLDGGPIERSRSISVAEVVAPDTAAPHHATRDLVVALVRAGVTSTVSHGAGTRYGSMDTDSNLPDVRLAIGGPDENAFTAAVLDAVGDAYRDEVRRQLRHGVATVWVPAARPLAEVWRPNADLRGVRDLPVLIVAAADLDATATAVTGIAAQLADHRILVRQPGALHASEAHAAQRTFGVLNVGLPGCNVTTDGSLYLSLMRSCSGWPSGVWLDPPRRSTPDGSSFQFQHWTHRFEYALVAGGGDWRDVGLVRAGHEHNNPFHVRRLDGPGGRLPPTCSFVRPDADGVVIAAVKPAGNPMARMARVEDDPSPRITLRCYEAHGREVRDAKVAFLSAITEASRADLLEQPAAALQVDTTEVSLHLDPYEIATLQVTTEPPEPGPWAAIGRGQEPAQPVFGDYWLHNRGAAPLGYQPVTVRIVERAVQATGPFRIEISVASQLVDATATGFVDLVGPVGWRIDPHRRSYHLAPGAFERFSVTVTPPPQVPPGRRFVAARISDDQGQVHEDVATVDVGSVGATTATPIIPGHRRLFLERATRNAAIVERPMEDASVASFGGELSATIMDEVIRLHHGDSAELRVRLDNHVVDAVRGEAQLISPWGTWELTWPWTTGFEVAADASATVPFTVHCPVGTPPSTSWALVKVMYFGRVLYTPSIPLLFGHAADGEGARA